MGRSKGGYYAVQNGRETGVFSNWNDCKDQVSGYSGASFKRFDSSEAAQQFSSGGNQSSYSSSGSGGNSGYSSGGGQSSYSSYGGGGGSSYGSSRPNYSNSSYGNQSQSSTSSYGNQSYGSGFNFGSGQSSYSAPKAKSKPVYAVANGRNTGVYDSWDQCKDQVNGYQNAVYKKFDTPEEAQRFVSANKSQSQPARSTQGSGFRSTPITSQQGSGGPYYSIVFKNGESKIVNSWSECQSETKGVQGTAFKKFDTLNEAKTFASQGASQHRQLSPSSREARTQRFLENNSRELMNEQASMKPTVVYCDGSFIPGSFGGRDKAGYGVYYGPNDPRNVSKTLTGPNQNSFISEAKATAHVLKQISKEIDNYSRHDGPDLLPKYSISSDSETMKNILDQYAHTWTDKDFQKRSDVPELKEMVNDYKKIKEFYNDNAPIFGDHKFEVTWVKGHSGIDGNEQADRLARQGAEGYNTGNNSWW